MLYLSTNSYRLSTVRSLQTPRKCPRLDVLFSKKQSARFKSAMREQRSLLSVSTPAHCGTSGESAALPQRDEGRSANSRPQSSPPQEVAHSCPRKDPSAVERRQA